MLILPVSLPSLTFLHHFKNEKNAKQRIKTVVYDKELINIDKVLDQIPTRYIFDYLKKKLMSKIIKNWL